MRKVTPALREKVLNDFYWKHHHKLSETVDTQLNLFGKALIVDCHSYSYNKNKNVQTIMLEINRDLYLKELTNDKSERYLEVKNITSEFIKTIRKCL